MKKFAIAFLLSSIIIVAKGPSDDPSIYGDDLVQQQQRQQPVQQPLPSIGQEVWNFFSDLIGSDQPAQTASDQSQPQAPAASARRRTTLFSCLAEPASQLLARVSQQGSNDQVEQQQQQQIQAAVDPATVAQAQQQQDQQDQTEFLDLSVLPNDKRKQIVAVYRMLSGQQPSEIEY